MYMHVVGTTFYNMIVHILLILITNCLFFYSCSTVLLQFQFKVMYTHTLHNYITSIRTYVIILFYKAVLYHVEFCLFSARMCLLLARQILRKLFWFDVCVSYQYLLFVVYSVMLVCLYTELKLASCTYDVSTPHAHVHHASFNSVYKQTNITE